MNPCVVAAAGIAGGHKRRYSPKAGRASKIMCPLCGSKITRTILSQAAWAINECTVCTNAWTVPYPSKLDYAASDFHASAIHPAITGRTREAITGVDELPEEWKLCIRRQCRLLARHLPNNARVLEVGCGEGLLLSELSKLGFNVEGIEPSESGSFRARRKGLNVATGYFPQRQPAGHFDAVILSHVLEHLSDPIAILQSTSRIAPLGYLLLIQTHYKGLIPRWDKANWYAWAPHEHFWHFTPEGLKRLSHSLGFRPVACEFSSLIHGARRAAKLASTISSLIPSALDQFHLLLKLDASPAAGKEQIT
jgi:2-polyprenyl-3-methyl-5-hydroxy-6-metoxy-1,4-benzoquinol methylase